MASSIENGFNEYYSIIKLPSKTVDMSNGSVVLESCKSFKNDIIINTAAYTAIDKSGSEPEIVAAVNSFGPENIALAAKSVGAKFIHLSTDYVFMDLIHILILKPIL